MEFTLETLDGCKLIRAVFPPEFDMATAAAAAARYLTLWDDGKPGVGLGDVTRLTTIEGPTREVMTVLLRRVTILPGYLGSAWVTGSGAATLEPLREIVAAAGRDPASIFETEAEALAYLRARIAVSRRPT